MDYANPKGDQKAITATNGRTIPCHNGKLNKDQHVSMKCWCVFVEPWIEYWGY